MDEKTIARFWAKVDIRGPDECWNWTAGCTSRGYGSFGISVRGRVSWRTHQAHRVAFLLTHGHWPKPCGCHSCDNVRCCNPAHVWEGTQRDNIVDRNVKGRANMPRGEASGMSKLTVADVIAIRSARAAGETLQSIADGFGVCHSSIGRIARRQVWKHVR